MIIFQTRHRYQLLGLLAKAKEFENETPPSSTGVTGQLSQNKGGLTRYPTLPTDINTQTTPFPH